MNYRHLQYFSTVVRQGSIARASESLHLTPQTLSAQIKLLEQRVGARLLQKAGRGVEATASGRLVQRYAEEIFSLGDALQDALSSGRRGGPDATVLRVGVADTVPKSIACHVLEPCRALLQTGRLVCHEGRLAALLGELAVHRLDLIVSDVPLPASLSVRAYTHLLGRTGVSFFAAEAMLEEAGLTPRRARGRFPGCLDELPLLLPGADSALRPRIEAWLRENGLGPRIVAEFDDSALAKAFGRIGFGAFAGPTALADEIALQYRAVRLGDATALIEECYAISIERRITHPAVAAITDAARRGLFGQDRGDRFRDRPSSIRTTRGKGA